MINQVKGSKRIVFPEGDNETVLQAAAQLVEQRICSPILLGVDRIDRMVEELSTTTKLRPALRRAAKNRLCERLSDDRQGITWPDAARLLKSRPYFAAQHGSAVT